MAIVSVNPATEEELARYQEHTWDDVDASLERAWQARLPWRETSFGGRSARLADLAGQLRREKDRLAALLTAEMGKPLVEAEAEVEKCAWTAEWYAENLENLLADREVQSTALVFRAAIPALAGGNVMVLKHASNVPQSALAAEGVCRAAGFPEGAFQTLLVGNQAVERVIRDRRVAGVTLTGSDAAGAKVARVAGEELKKAVLELGGSDPFVVLEDADLEQAATVACRARNQNNGQSCIAAKRFILVDSIAEEFERRFCEAVAALKVGDPTRRDTNVGPLARADLVDDLERQVQESVRMGARQAVEGGRVPGRGFYYRPAVLTEVTREMPVFREETFGPVAAVIRVRDEEEAVAVANDTVYGLGSNLWTGDPDRGRRLATRIEAGIVFINGMVASEARLPFGGVKRSGYGRELSEFGTHEFMNVQTVWMGPARSAEAQKGSE